MVASELLRELKVVYKETNHLDFQDKSHVSALYSVNLLDGEYVIALGMVRTEYSKNGVVYYPIYLISPSQRIKAKIGVYEVDAAKTIHLVDDDGDVDLNKLGEPLLFSFVTREYLDKYGLDGSQFSIETPKDDEKDDNVDIDVVDIESDLEEDIVEDKANLDDNEDEEDDEDEDLFSLKKTEAKEEATDTEETKPDADADTQKHLSLDDLFVKDEPLPTMPTWATETAEDAKKMRDFYKKNKSMQDNWVIQYMHNKEYKALPNEGGGDCFFAVIRDAYAQMGYRTTIPKLRTFLSQEVTVDLYENYKKIYEGFVMEVENANEELSRLTKVNRELRKQSDATRSANHQKEILNEAVKVKQDYTTYKIQKGGADDLISEFAFMKHIQHVEDLKAFVQTSEYWADSWALSTLELLLSMKLIVLENTDDVDSVMHCTQANDDAAVYSQYDPKYYIVTAYSGSNHYELVSYKDKSIFKFPEVPYDMKVKVVRTCIENNDQSYYASIPAFRQFRHEMGIAESKPNAETQSEEDKERMRQLYDPNLMLKFHIGSDKKKKAGDNTLDIVPKERKNEFAVLNSIELWRQKLDDAWALDAFTTVDGKRWNSIAHYLLAVPFKDSHPAIYDEFSDDSKSDISKEVTKAKVSLEKKKDKIGRHYEVFKKVPKMDEAALEVYRKEALRAKFARETPLGRMLMATQMARLEQFRRNREPKTDISLMEVRAELLSAQ